MQQTALPELSTEELLVVLALASSPGEFGENMCARFYDLIEGDRASPPLTPRERYITAAAHALERLSQRTGTSYVLVRERTIIDARRYLTGIPVEPGAAIDVDPSSVDHGQVMAAETDDHLIDGDRNVEHIVELVTTGVVRTRSVRGGCLVGQPTVYALGVDGMWQHFGQGSGCRLEVQRIVAS